MDKIGILTAIRTNNNGTDLQAYAMQQMFQKKGCDVVLINYRYERHSTLMKILFFPCNLTKVIRAPFNLYQDINHKLFRRKNFIRTKHLFKKKDISNIQIPKIIVGSDQVWNLENMQGDINFFLPWTNDNICRYSYAASFGRTSLSEWEKKYEISKYLNQFKKISVRESSAVNALAKIGVESREDLDPLLMLEKEDWEQLVPYNNIKYKGRYILLYLVEENREAEEVAVNYAKSNKLLIYYPTFRIRPRKHIKQLHFVGVKQWLSLLMNAEYVVTNSYHCMSLALLFDKNMKVFMLQNNIESNSRMINLANKLKICDNNSLSISSIDCSLQKRKKVTECIKELRLKSNCYIDTIISGGEEIVI